MMEKELSNILLELPKLHKEGNGEFLAINVEEDIEEETDSSEESSPDEIVANVFLRKWQIEEEIMAAGFTSLSSGLANSIKKNILLHTSRDSSPACIYKVPAKLKKLNMAAYTPRSVSIGPIHYGKPELHEMQRYKWRFLDRYLKQSQVSLDFLVQTACNMENQVRQYYQESFDDIRSEEFSEMIMLDGIFLIVLLQEKDRVKLGSPTALPASSIVQPSIKAERAYAITDLNLSGSAITHISKNYWVRSEIIHDLMLLENQLPFFVLQNFHKYVRFQLELEESIPEFFAKFENIGTFQERKKPSKAKHLVDFLRSYYKPKHHPRTKGKTVYNHRSAAELKEAGVRFQSVLGCNICEIKFLGGELVIPRLRIDEHTDTLFRNLIAFEQCQYGEREDITSYVTFMDSLIHTPKDVDLLVRFDILQNYYGESERVADLFHNLHKETARRDSEFYFGELCTELNEYSRDSWHQWKDRWFRTYYGLKRYYFSTPGSTVSFAAAVILLVLTIVQTACSVISMF